LKRVWDLEESGPTALGPALMLSICIAGRRPAGKVVLCTDGLANLGLGSLEGRTSEFSPFYIELGEMALLQGTTVSVISMLGTECSLETLSAVTEKTAGAVERVDPLRLISNFSSILSKPLIATCAMANVLLHKSLMFRNEVDDELDDARNFLVKDIGNVTSDTECTFSYGFRPKQPNGVDYTAGLSSLPFQVQVAFNKLDGTKVLRVATAHLQLTDNRSMAEKNADIKVIGTYAAQRAAKYAKEGEYEKAQLQTRAAQRLMLRNFKPSSEIKNWEKTVEGLDKALREERKKEAKDKKVRTKKEREAERRNKDDTSWAIAKTAKVASDSLFA